MKVINHDNLYKKLEQIVKKEISHALLQYIFDTTNKSMATKSSVTYDKKGVVVISETWKDFELEWGPVIPDTTGEFGLFW